MMRIRALSCLLVLALGGCSISNFLPQLTPEDPAGPEPLHRFLIAGRIKTIVGGSIATGTLQISSVRRIDALKGASWIACLKVQPFTLALPYYYAVFIQRDRIVDSRLSVLIDQCEIQSYSSFDWVTEAERPGQ